MISSYFKIALRYLAKSKIYSFINMAGLSLGLACVMLIILYTKDELSFDGFHNNVNSIYQVTIDVRFTDGSSMDKFGGTSTILAPTVKTNLPEIESYIRLSKTFWDIKLGDEVQSQSVIQTDTNFFTMLTFPLLQGNSKTALRLPSSVVISEDVAIKHFGTVDALNKTLMFERDGVFKPYIVTGVAKRCPQNSSIQFEVVLPLNLSIEEEQRIDNWASADVNTLLRLSKGSDAKAVATKMQELFERESKEAFEPVRKSGFTQTFNHQLQPFTDIHLSQEFTAENGFVNGSDPIYSYILSGIALFILAIACINFVNLTIAQSVKRAKEIGIRKVIGSGRQQLIGQFLGESFLLCCISFVGALLIAQLMLPLFNEMTNKALSLSYLMDSDLLVGYFFLFLTTAMLAGFYPAIVLSGYSPVQTLYNQFRLTGKNYLQKGLIVFQFALATVMIIATLTIYLQFDYLTTKDLGFEPDNVVEVKKRNLTPQESKLFGDELMKNPTIVSVSPQGHGMMNAKINGEDIRNFTYDVVNEDFVDLLKISILRGRNFSESLSDSAHAVLVNEAFVKMAGWKEPIGEEVNFFVSNGGIKTVVGVVKDYHYAPLSKAIEPQLFVPSPGADDKYKQVLIRMKPNSEATSLPHIEKTFKKLFPLVPYSYQFYNEINLQHYEAESKWKKVILLSALLTIFIAGIGLFGLSILTAERRFKEIGIRKVLGASVKTIVITLTKDFLLLISLAMLIAMPFAYYASNTWLETYPYRTDVGSGTFVGAALLILIIALITTGYQSIKTALMNPVEALKRE